MEQGTKKTGYTIQQSGTRGNGIEVWAVVCGTRLVADGLNKFEAELFAAAPDMLDALDAVLRAFNLGNPNWAVVANQAADAIANAKGGAL